MFTEHHKIAVNLINLEVVIWREILGFFDESDRESVLEERDDVGSRKRGSQDLDDLPDQLEETLVLGEHSAEYNVAKHSNSSRGKVKHFTCNTTGYLL